MLHDLVTLGQTAILLHNLGDCSTYRRVRLVSFSSSGEMVPFS